MDSKAKRVVVGYDTSKESEFALEWAARVAERRGVPLLVVHATGVERPGVSMARAGVLEMYQRRAQEIADEGARRARQFANIAIEAAGVQRGAAAALTDYSKDAGLLVIGHRSMGMLSDTLLGSVAFAVTTHAACPVAVIRSSLRPLPSQKYPVVVGVDGSDHSSFALREAAWLAADTGSFLRIVVAWMRPESNLWSTAFVDWAAGDQARSQAVDDVGAGQSSPSSGPDGTTYQQVVADATQRAADTAQWAVEQVREHYPDLRMEQAITEGRAEQAIVDAAADASLIVVGARGFGDLKSLLLGSVSRKVMQRAECAVYVIR